MSVESKSSPTIWSDKVRSQRLLYLALCPQSDREVLTYQKDMTIKDFERITYLLEQLNFDEYCFYLEKEYEHFIEDLGKEILNNLVPKKDRKSKRACRKAQLEEAQQWSEDFCLSLPESIREYIMELLN